MPPLALIVENDAGTRRLLQVLLARAGYDCDSVGSGSEGFLLARHVEYDAYFFDLILPGTSGMQILELLDDDAQQRTTILSAASEKQLDRVRGAWPAVRVVRKPFDLDEVMTIAQDVAAGRAPRARTGAEDFCRRSVAAGAKAGVIVRRTGANVAPVLSYGYPAGVLESYFPLTVDGPYPICDAMRSRRAVWLDSLTEIARLYSPVAKDFERNASHAAAVVPLVRDEEVVGAAGWTFREPHRFADVDQRTFTAIAQPWSERIDAAGATGG